MKRREFINWVGLGAIASCLPVALAACTKSDTVADTEENTTSASELLTVGTVAQLEESGFLLDEEAKVLVVKDSTGELMAVNPTCTHQGCIVEWQQDESIFLCPCHAAKYAPDGEVLAEPASSPLSTYKAIAEQGEVLVEIV